MIINALPCPFCNGTDLSFISDIDGIGRDVEIIVCNNIKCLVEGHIGKNKEEALSFWNKRYYHDNLDNTLKRKIETLKEIEKELLKKD